MAARKSAARKGGARKAPAARDDEDEDEDEDGDDAICTLTHLEPGQVAISIATFEGMLAAKTQSEEQTAAQARLNDVNFTGLRNTVDTVHGSLSKMEERFDKERALNAEKDKEIIRLHMQIAEMTRASEDARLEREKIESARQEGERELAGLRLRLTNERDMARDEMKSILSAGQELIAGIAPLALPFFAAWMKKNGFGDVPMAGPSMGLPHGPQPQPQARPQVRFQMTDADIERWLQVLQSGLGQFSNDSAAVLRALICNSLFAIDGAPAVNTNKLIEYIGKDVGPQMLGEFVELTQRAWRPIQHEHTSANGTSASSN